MPVALMCESLQRFSAALDLSPRARLSAPKASHATTCARYPRRRSRLLSLSLSSAKVNFPLRPSRAISSRKRSVSLTTSSYSSANIANENRSI